MMKNKWTPWKVNLLLLIVASTIHSCTIFHRVKEGETYFKRHSIKVHDAPSEYKVSQSELINLTKLKPNRKILFARFNLGIYTLVPENALRRSEDRMARKCPEVNKKRTKKGKRPRDCQNFWMWMAYTVGEPPAQLDSSKMERGAAQMSTYLTKRGFFNNKVIPTVIYKNKGLVFWRKGKKCRVVYEVYPNAPYHIRNLEYKIEDPMMAKRSQELIEGTLLKTGSLFDVDIFDKERERIANFFNDRGYYEFTKDYITYDVDSTIGKNLTDVVLRLRMPQAPNSVSKDSLSYIPHKKFFIGNVYVYTDSDPLDPEEAFKDTIYYRGLRIISNGTPSVKESLLEYTTLFGSGEIYKKDRVDLTYRRFTRLGTFKAVNIQLLPRTFVDSTGINYLDAYIRLNPAKKQLFGVDPRITNRAGNNGLYGTLLYRHRNVFRGAESFEMRIITGFEATRAITEESFNETGGQEVRRSFQLNTFELGPEISLRIPRIFGAPFIEMKKNSEPFTNFSIAVNYQRRPDYERTLTLFRTQWGFTENKDKGTQFFPHWDLSIITIQKSPQFQAFLDRLDDSFLSNSYQNHLVHSAGIDFVQNTQKTRFQRFYFFHKYGFELAGKVLPPLLARAVSAQQDELGRYYFGGNQYADYVKIDGDSRFYYSVNERNTVVFRASGGVGFAGKNLPALPFEESFFSGGANGIRAWQARTLGPGSFRDTTTLRTFNNIGDVQIEFNFEYRFKMTQMFQAAFFVDAGNIWLLSADNSRPGAEFRSNTFIGEIAVGSGLGLRLDFEYFLVRLDLGLQLKDPLKIEGERWFWQPKDEFNTFLRSIDNTELAARYVPNRVLNFGIGFPF